MARIMQDSFLVCFYTEYWACLHSCTPAWAVQGRTQRLLVHVLASFALPSSRPLWGAMLAIELSQGAAYISSFLRPLLLDCVDCENQHNLRSQRIARSGSVSATPDARLSNPSMAAFYAGSRIRPVLHLGMPMLRFIPICVDVYMFRCTAAHWPT